MSSSNTNPIEMRDVSVAAIRNPNSVVTENVNWTVKACEYWAIGGRHASGKSDFMMMTGGITAPKAGTYQLFGEPMPIFDDARLGHRLRLGLVFDGGQLFNRLTIEENIALPRKYHHRESAEETSRYVAAILDATELTSWTNSTPSAISRNWHKRAGLARALVLKPEILLLDNPLGGLDWRHTNWWLRFLDELSAGHPLMDGKPVTLVVTADNLRPWLEHARQFAFLRDKEFVIAGDRSRLGAGAEPFLKELLSEGTIQV